jgi:hypothetical protein
MIFHYLFFIVNIAFTLILSPSPKKRPLEENETYAGLKIGDSLLM